MRIAQWISNDVASIQHRIMHGVVALVPRHLWSQQPGKRGETTSSINHLLLHTARHHDLAVATAIRNRPPLFEAHRAGLGLAAAPAGAGIEEREDRAVTADLPGDALVAYVEDTLSSTTRWLPRLGDLVMDSVPTTSRRLATKAGLDAVDFDWLHAMWAGKTVGELLQWPVVGHGHNHVGEMIAVRNALGFSPH